jgi:hypothetical protein
MDVTISTLSLPDEPFILSVKSKDITRQFHLCRETRTLRFPWGLSGELNFQLLKESGPVESLVLDQYLELGSQEDRLEIGNVALSVAVLPAAPKRQDANHPSRASDRDHDRKFLEDSGLAKVLEAALSQVLMERPENALDALIEHLKTHKA